MNYNKNMLYFAEGCEIISEKIAADAYISHDNLSLYAGLYLKESVGGRLVYDAIEIPGLNGRSGPRINSHPDVAMRFLNLCFNNFIRRCDLIMTVSDPLAEIIRDEYAKDNVITIKNCRWFENVEKNLSIRHDCGVSDDDVLVLYLSTITQSFIFDKVVEALSLCPPNFHLVTLGRFVPTEYREQIKETERVLGVQHRITYLDPVPYDKLSSYISGVDMGLIIFDTQIINNYVSLPNRLFDYITARLPICASNMPNIARIINEYHIGEVIEANSAELLASALQRIDLKRTSYQPALQHAAKELCWENVEPDLLSQFEDCETITFISLKDLTRNNRVQRMATTFLAAGKKVRVVTTRPMETVSSGIDWYWINLSDPGNLIPD